MKSFKLVLLIFWASVLLLNSCCNKGVPQPIAAVKLQFTGFTNSDMADVFIIETLREDINIHIDTMDYGQLRESNNYSILLEFKLKTEDNGNYIIMVDSMIEPHIITDVQINVKEKRCKTIIESFSFKFDGILKTNKDYIIIINRINK